MVVFAVSSSRLNCSRPCSVPHRGTCASVYCSGCFGFEELVVDLGGVGRGRLDA